MNNCIAVLDNNLKFLKILLDNLSSCDMTNITICIVNEVRIGNKLNDIEKLISQYHYNIKLISSEDIICQFKKDVIENSFVDEYTMSMNILMLWYLMKYYNFDKILFIDDDVVLLNGFEEVFTHSNHLFYNHRLCAGNTDFNTESNHRKEVLLEWFNIFDITFSEYFWTNIYLKKYINTGQFVVDKTYFDVVKYEHKLK